ncbi:leucine-rich repeat domain-containing protein [Culicoidibacter larvae]|uniref:LPXTG cell wall anchor domain-containing protein n=1 Tax=Culicoidibacter larvae TaxID=2579976 RepID=A0A5R8QCR1_9FIRM|nr:leucine-rich repeat domain-containing protein [Culicoidibacter larvae]TLG74315.1 LPXTG cell wall anchor domain-containing protein [Culicoidibacter larvae]
MKIFSKILFSFILLTTITGTSIYVGESQKEIVQATYESTPPPAAINEIFPDANFASTIASLFGVSSDTVVTQSDLDSIDQLYASLKNIVNLDGIQHLKELRILYLDGNEINDVSPITTSEFPLLEILILNDNQIDDISPFATASFPSLRVLGFDNNQISDISPLITANFPSLLSLGLDNLEISDINPIASFNFPRLQGLGMGRNQISDITPLKNATFPDLRHILLDDNKISDITPFTETHFPNLDTIFLDRNQISDISSLTNFNFPRMSVLRLAEQEINLNPVNFAEHITIQNDITNIDGTIINPETISNNGIYSEPNISWDLLTYTSNLTYSFNHVFSYNFGLYELDYEFSGNVNQPLKELFKVSFSVDSSIIEENTIAYGDVINKPITPTKPGYSFLGWYTEPIGGTKWNFNSDAMPENDLILYAQWQENSVSETSDNNLTSTITTLPNTGSNSLEAIIIGVLTVLSAGILYVVNKNRKKI